MIGNAEDYQSLRDDPMDPLSVRDRHAAAMLRLFREQIPGFGDGRGSPKEMARIAAEYHLSVHHKDGDDDG